MVFVQEAITTYMEEKDGYLRIPYVTRNCFLPVRPSPKNVPTKLIANNWNLEMHMIFYLLITKKNLSILSIQYNYMCKMIHDHRWKSWIFSQHQWYISWGWMCQKTVFCLGSCMCFKSKEKITHEYIGNYARKHPRSEGVLRKTYG